MGMTGSERFLRACRLEAVDRTPVWFLRQAGRYMPEYRNIRQRRGLLEMFKTPEIAAEVTLQPLRVLGVDAAIIFADILLPLEAMGVGIEFPEGEGPLIQRPVRSTADADRLRVAEPDEDLAYVLEALRIVRNEIDGKYGLIGFAGAPFTLASYMIEGGSSRSYLRTKQMMYEQRGAWATLMEKLAETITRYLIAQARAGAQALQLFDSWVGCLSPSDYREYVLPYTRRIFSELREAGILSVHFGTGNADLLPLMRAAGGDVIGVDWRTNLDDAWTRVGAGVAVQGNLDPATLFAPWNVVETKAREVLNRAGGRAGHIFNVGHGILPATPVETVKALVDLVHDDRRPRH
jgi:uroporphyrinogen decarboxylase